MVDINPYASPQTTSVENSSKSRFEVVRCLPIACRWIVALAIVSLLIGSGSRTIRPYVTGTVHYESFVAMLSLFLLSLALLLRFWRFPLPQATAALQIGLLSVGSSFFAGWSAVHIAGWSAVYRGMWEDLGRISLVCWLGCAVIGSLVLLIPHKRYSRRPT